MKRQIRDSEESGFTMSVGRRATSSKAKIWSLLGLFFFLAGLTYLFFITRGLPSLQQLEEYKPKLASIVYSSDLKVIHEYYEQKRSFVPLEEMPEHLLEAVMATEDRRFYEHWGMDLRRLLGAVFKNIITADLSAQGASTLTQQLAKQLFLTSEKTLTRKIKELITAIQIERTYTKPEILEMYLNHMYFGQSAYGVQSASVIFFGKNVQDIEPGESAILIGLLKAPNWYSPVRHPNRCLTRRNIVLNAMREVDFLSEEEYKSFVSNPINLTDEKNTAYGLAPYFTEYVRQIMQQKYGYNLYTAGLSIYTTLDSRAQYLAEKSVQDNIWKIQKGVRDYYIGEKLVDKLLTEDFKNNHEDWMVMLTDSVFVDSLINKKARAEVALVSIDPRNGHIIALIGGRNFDESKFNRAVQARRQPGSAFKPFIYTAAVDNGYPPSYEVLNQPVVVMMPDGSRWSPRNFGLTVGGPTTFREGLRKSYNLVTVRVLQELIKKPSIVVDYAHKLGIKSPLVAVDAIALGASEVTPLEIASAYGTFANRGIHYEPIAILRVEDKNGNIIEQHVPQSREVLREETAYIITNMLQTVIDHGTGARARWMYHFNRKAGGKTGTTNDYSDAWFLGFTPQIVTSVWVGVDEYSVGDFKLTLGKNKTGSNTALPIWGPYMKAVHDSLALPELDFPMPQGVVKVEICEDSKLLAQDNCPCNVVEEIFFRDLAPTEYCDSGAGTTRRTNDRRDKDRKRF